MLVQQVCVCVMCVKPTKNFLPHTRFRVLHSCIQLQPSNVESAVLASCVLHNLLRRRLNLRDEVDVEDPDTHDVAPAPWRMDPPLPSLARLPRGNHDYQQAKAVRDTLQTYYTSEVGSVPWQDRMI